MDLKWKLYLVFSLFQNVPVEARKYNLIVIPDLRSSKHLNERNEDDKDRQLQNLYPGTKFDYETNEEANLGTFEYNLEMIDDLDNKDVSQGIDFEEVPNVDTFNYNLEMVDNFDDKVNDVSLGTDTGNVYGDDKIVGGDEVDISLFPYHAAYGTNCGGAIIAKTWVITDAHCGSAKQFIRVGSRKRGQGRKIGIKKHFVHPGWSALIKVHPFDYDFQLLELDTPLRFNTLIKPIKIARMADMKVGVNLLVSGWGHTKEGGNYSPVLRAIQVPIIPKNVCTKVQFPFFNGLTSRMFCAGYKEGIKDACQGDSGGPAVHNHRLYGLVSFGWGCATPNSYGVYSKVAKVRAWIEKVSGLELD